MVCVGLSEKDLKNFGGPVGGPGKILAEQWPPWHPPSSALAVTLTSPALHAREVFQK